jgi:hypothetical protein
MFTNHLRLPAAVLALSVAFLAGASARAGDFNPSGTWKGSYKNSKGDKQKDSRITIRQTDDGGWTGDWDGWQIEDMTVIGDKAHWTHRDDHGRYWEVTATRSGGELKVHYDVHEGPQYFCGAFVGYEKDVYHGDGVFKR